MYRLLGLLCVAASLFLSVGPAPIGAAGLDVAPAAAALDAVSDGPAEPPAADGPQAAQQMSPEPTTAPAGGGTRGKIAVPTGSSSPAPSASPVASAAPSASPAPGRHRLPGHDRPLGRKISLGIESYTSFINQHFVGPGIAPPEATFFSGFTGAGGNVCATQPFATPLGLVSAPGGCPAYPGLGVVGPKTPYDLASGGPQVTGNGLHQAMYLTFTMHASKFVDASAQVGYGSVGGIANVDAYWGQRSMPPLNAALGQHPVSDGASAAFPVAPGQNTYSASRITILQGTIARHDGKAALRAGWFDLQQSEPHVFAPTVSPQSLIGLQPVLPEGLSDGAPSMDLFKPLTSSLPLYGADLTATIKGNDYEVTDALLPASSDTPVRMLSISAHTDRGHGLTYGAQFARVTSGGFPVGSQVLFGSGPGIIPSAQGPIPFSTIGAQKMVIGGVDATWNVTADIDASVKYGHSCYQANGTALNSSRCAEGSYYYARLHHGFRAYDIAVEAMRSEATYAPMILPYGTITNTWSSRDAWPGTWLKNDYQLVDNSKMGPNRQGIRLSSTFVVLKNVETRVAYAQYGQILPFDRTTAFQPGFVEAYFLPQFGGTGATLGGEQHGSASFIWKPKGATVQLDLTDITTFRAGTAFHPEDAVSMNYPSAVFSVSKQLKPKLFAAVGAGRYAIDGSFANSGAKNADLSQKVVFGGFQLLNNETSGYYLQYRMYSTRGTPTLPLGPSPNYHGPQIYLEQRLKT